MCCPRLSLLAGSISRESPRPKRETGPSANRTMSEAKASKVPSTQPGPPPAKAAATETRLAGHLGHLTPEEQKAFEEFKKISADKGFYTPATANTKASHDDGTLV